MKNEKIKQLIEGKTIEKVEFPDLLKFKIADEDSTYDEPIICYHNCADDNIQITFTDGTILKLSSWDYEGYSSGIYKEVVPKLNGEDITWKKTENKTEINA